MKYSYKLIILLFILGVLNGGLYAQAKKKTNSKSKKAKTESNFWQDDMWYGGGLNLQFYTTYLGSYPGNVFEFGISPIAGYKIKKWWSVGPRLEFSYVGGRFDVVGDIYKLRGTNYGFGAFTRAKFLGFLFAHVEYSRISTLLITGNIVDDKIETDRKFRDHFYTGLGYNPSESLSYEIYLLFDWLAPEDSVDLPIQFRAGLTYNF